MPGRSAIDELVGRQQIFARLGDLLARALNGQRVTVLVSGEAGIGKTSLLRAVVAQATQQGAQTSWGTSVDADGAPGHWPWTQVLNGLVRGIGPEEARRLAGDDAPLLATIVSSLGLPARVEATDRARLLLLDATTRFLDALASDRPLVVVLDDLQWADQSSLALFDFVARAPHRSGVCLIGVYRHDELNDSVRERLSGLITHSHHLHLQGLGTDAVHELVERLLARPVDRSMTEAIHRRTGGHPLFVREVAILADHDDGTVEPVPSAVRDLIERRIGRLSGATRDVLQVTAVMGNELVADIVAAALGISPLAVEVAARDAVDGGVLSATGDGLRFTHDLLRESFLNRLEASRRVALHQAIGLALERRMARAGDVAPAELARHFIAAIPLEGPHRAIRWALAAAAADCGTLAFLEAAAHLRRLRAALADGAVDVEDNLRFEVLVAEADALARAGSIIDARGLLRAASDIAVCAGDADGTARVALAVAQLGARFAYRRDEIVGELERALSVVTGAHPVREAQVTAALARELQHSVPEDRPRAGPLSERAIKLGRGAGDAATLASCLLARHDVLWTPGAEQDRSEIAREIVAIARAAGDEERHAEGLLLLANALLEQGSPAFEVALDACLAILDRLGQPRHRYLAETRRGCVALLVGRLDEAEMRVIEAAALGDRIREPDTSNVFMSQRLEIVRAGGKADDLRAFATEAVAHWTGAPIHAHAVAAGFFARAGDLEAARHHVAAVVDLGTWRADRSYLWSVFMRELAQAAVALGDREICEQLLDDLQPLMRSCGVNGAVVAFAGSHAHTAGLIAAGLGRLDISRLLLEQAGEIYERLGATRWLADVRGELAGLHVVEQAPVRGRSMRRHGAAWYIAFDNGASTTVPHSKGLADIARLLTLPGTDIHVLDLMDVADRSGRPGTLTDRQALEAYRQRLRDIDSEADESVRHHDDERLVRLDAERRALLDELRRTGNVQGRPRQFANHPAERARKAVTARIRDAIRRLEPLLPDLAAHLDQTILTGTYCRYRPDRPIAWDVDSTPGNPPTATTS